jgi:hypothetical protein
MSDPKSEAQYVRDELEQINRVLDSVPPNLINKLRVAEPTLVTTFEALDRLVDVVARILGAPTSLKPYVPQPQISGGKAMDKQPAPEYPPTRHYQTIGAEAEPAATVTAADAS